MKLLLTEWASRHSHIFDGAVLECSEDADWISREATMAEPVRVKVG